MKLGFATKHLQVHLAYREPDEDEKEYVANLDGDFTPVATDDDCPELRFGFAVDHG